MSAAERLRRLFADADWLDADRARAWLLMLAAATVIGTTVWFAMARDGLDLMGKPIGTDFVAFWSAGKVVRDGAAASGVYDRTVLAPAENAALAAPVPYTAFPYPPTFILACLLFASAPYLAALLAWLAVTGAAYWQVVRAWMPKVRLRWAAALAFPAVFVNAGHGQNGFLSAALFGGAALLLQRRPWIAGLLIGLLTYKPQLGLLIPVVLVASRNWRAIAGAAVSATLLAGLATAVLGLEAWQGFVASLSSTDAILVGRDMHPGKMQSVFAALRLWQAPIPLAYAVQGSATLATAASLAWLAWRRPASPGVGPAMAAGALLATPYLFDYDLVLAAIPLAWLFGEGVRCGFRPYEKVLLAAAFLLPLFSRSVAIGLHLPLGPVILGLLYLFTLRRAWTAEAA